MHFDEILHEIGNFGVYQRRLFALLALPCMSNGAIVLTVYAILATPIHRCKIPWLNNDTFAVQSPEHERLINATIPPSDTADLQYDKCHIYVYNSSDPSGVPDGHHYGNASMMLCKEWVYDKSVFLNTFTSDNNLVCGDAMKTSHIQMFLFFGIFIGAFFLGSLSDSIGRKTTMCLALTVCFVSGIGVTFVHGPYLFAVMQFIIGGSTHGMFLAVAVFVMEIVGATRRIFTGMMLQIFFAMGVCYVALVSFLLKSWQWINLAVVVPTGFYISFWWLIPESPRWLISKSRKKEALDIIQKMALINKNVGSFDNVSMISDVKGHGDAGKIWHVLRSPILLKRTLILAFNWMAVSITYYGVTFNAGNMGGNFYLNLFLMGFVEIPGLTLGMYTMQRFGRRKANAGTMVMAGVACLSTIPTAVIGSQSLQPLVIALALIGKALSAGAFGIVYIFTAELLPTVIRNASMGTCSCSARVGGMIAPYIAKMGELIGGQFGKVQPLIVFGALSLIAGLLLLTLPETMNKDLPDSIEEGEQFGTKRAQRADNEVEVELVPKE